MAYSNVALKDKIMDMYPEIVQHKISVGLDFSEEKDAFVVKLKRDSHELLSYIDKSDADECMNGVKCVHLNVKISEFINNFES